MYLCVWVCGCAVVLMCDVRVLARTLVTFVTVHACTCARVGAHVCACVRVRIPPYNPHQKIIRCPCVSVEGCIYEHSLTSETKTHTRTLVV
jgi:hypothetical protein